MMSLAIRCPYPGAIHQVILPAKAYKQIVESLPIFLSGSALNPHHRPPRKELPPREQPKNHRIQSQQALAMPQVREIGIIGDQPLRDRHPL